MVLSSDLWMSGLSSECEAWDSPGLLDHRAARFSLVGTTFSESFEGLTLHAV